MLDRALMILAKHICLMTFLAKNLLLLKIHANESRLKEAAEGFKAFEKELIDLTARLDQWDDEVDYSVSEMNREFSRETDEYSIPK